MDTSLITLTLEEMKEGMVFLNKNDIAFVVTEKYIDKDTGRIKLHCSTGSIHAVSGWTILDSYRVMSISMSHKCEFISLAETNVGDTLINTNGTICRIEKTAYNGGQICSLYDGTDEPYIVDSRFTIRVTDELQEGTTTSMLKEHLQQQDPHYLSPLFDSIGIKNNYSKKVIAALVFNCLLTNGLGIKVRDTQELRKQLAKGLCDIYEFEVICLASYWATDILEILKTREPSLKNISSVSRADFSNTYLWPFIKEHGIIPGIEL